MTGPAVQIVGLREFRAALRASEQATPRELTAAIRKVGDRVVLPRTRALSPRRSGRLERGYRVSAAGTSGKVTNVEPYGGGAEWGTHKKWTGFQKYGAPGDRAAGRAIDELADEIAEAMLEELTEIVTIHGWAT